MDTGDVMIGVIVLVFTVVLLLVGVYLISGQAQQTGVWATKRGQDVAKVGENALNMADQEEGTTSLQAKYKDVTIEGLASYFGVDVVKMKCQNDADYIKTTEHSIYVKNVHTDTFYCAEIEKVYTPKSKTDYIIRHGFFTLIFMVKKIGDFEKVYIALVDGKENIHSKVITLRPDIDTIEYKVYFDHVKYWGGRDDEELDDVKVKLVVAVKRYNNKEDIYIVSYIMNSMDS